MKMRPLKMGVYGMWWSMVLGTGMATISLGVLLYRVDWATRSCIQIGPVTCKVHKVSSNMWKGWRKGGWATIFSVLVNPTSWKKNAEVWGANVEKRCCSKPSEVQASFSPGFSKVY